MVISKPNFKGGPKRSQLNKAYKKAVSKFEDFDDEEQEQKTKINHIGIRELGQRRIIPFGKIIYSGRPFFIQYPELTDATYNVFTFVGPMGAGKSVCVRSMIYYTKMFDPDTITIVFDPMKMEYSKLSQKAETIQEIAKKKIYLMNEMLHDGGRPVKIEIQPDALKVFHLIPRFAVKREVWNDKENMFEDGFDHTTLEILKKDGGFIFAEDASYLTEDQLFNLLNYRELRSHQSIHFYLRLGIKLCNSRFGARQWFIGDLIDVLRDGVKKYMDKDDVEYYDDAEDDNKKGLSTMEMQLIEQLEKYNDAGLFVKNNDERSKFGLNFRKIIRIGRIINISYMGYKKTEKIGEDIVVGQTDLILERLIGISNEYYDAIRKIEQKMEITEWERYLLSKWNVSLWFEESEIFIPRDCPRPDIKKWPCIKRLDYLMSFGRKYGFKNFGFVTQRIQKVNHIIFEESNNIFLGPLIGEERDKILADFGVNKLNFNIPINGKEQETSIRDIVSTLRKEKHEWVYISKAMKTVAPIQTFDSPCG